MTNKVDLVLLQMILVSVLVIVLMKVYSLMIVNWCSRAQSAYYSMIRFDNDKVQFKYERYGHCWTSMRARCSFHISTPNEGSIALLKLYTQQCQ